MPKTTIPTKAQRFGRSDAPAAETTPARPVPPASLALPPADVSGLEVYHSPCDPRKDLHVFVEYVQGREVKRSVRGNALSKADAARLAKLLSDPDAADEVKENGAARWVDFIDGLALKLGFVSYDTKGIYAGYSSSEASFPDNYIQFNAAAYEKYLAASLAEQERRLLDLLVNEYRRGEYDSAYNEFYTTGVLGRLSSFDTWGSATGVMPDLDFAEIRRFLLNVLTACPAGVWLSTASLVAYLKAEYPYFLIPLKPKPDRWGQPARRYGNFREHRGSQWGNPTDMPDDAPDGFERVEGRYVERFLEGIPLVLGYVDVAYGEPEPKDLFPALNCLRAFKVNARLRHALQRNIPAPKVTVQPNFEVYVDSEFYPADALAKLTPLTELVSADVVTILRLQKEKVAAQLALDERLDVVALLTRLAGRDLPQNVARELREWTAHSEKFTLYQGFALLEGDGDLPVADPFTVERIAPAIRLIHSPEDLYLRLEEAERVPLLVKHSDAAFQRLPQGARTVFAVKGQAAPRPAEKRAVLISRETRITLHFYEDEVLEKVRKALLDARCSVEVDKPVHTITYAGRYEPQVTAIIEALQKEYRVQVMELE